MKIYLLMKHTLKENYKYFLSLLLAYGFMAILYQITFNEEIQNYGIQIVTYGLTFVNALILPSVLFRNYYHQTNANHQASIPMTRLEIFFSQYMVGLGLGIAMILGYSCLTTLLTHPISSFVAYCSGLLMCFIYYYHISLLAFWICGDFMFQSIVNLAFIFGPVLLYLVYQWALEMYDPTFMFLGDISTLMKLLPMVGCCSYWLEVNPTPYYSLYLNEIVVFIILIVVSVRFRRYERTGQSMVFHSLSYLVRSAIVLLVSSGCFALFGSILSADDYMGQLVTSIIISVMVSYIVEMIYKKNIKVFHSIKYGLLAALVVFGVIHEGTSALEGYIPSNFDFVSLEVNDYYGGYNEALIIEEDSDLELIVKLNRQLMEVFDENDYSGGRITIEYYNEEKHSFFARQYALDEKSLEYLFNHEDYHDLMIDAFTMQEQALLDTLTSRVPITFILDNVYDENGFAIKYTLQKESEFYLFENYLKQGLEKLKESSLDLTSYNASQNYMTYYCEKTDEDYIVETISSPVVYEALQKTFGF